MKKLVLFFTILFLSGCSLGKEQTIIDAPKFAIEKDTIDLVLANSGLLEQNIYHPDQDVVILEAAEGRRFEMPYDYELALEKQYPIKASSTSYRILLLRQSDKIDDEPFTDMTQRMPDKPLIVAILNNDEKIVRLFVISRFSVLGGSMGWEDYDKSKIASALELKDLNEDGILDILIHTFKGYTADTENSLVTIYFDKGNNTFAYAEKIFWSTWKDAFKLIEVNDKQYVIEANSGSGSCRICPTPYMVRIYKFTGDYYFDIGSVGVEEEYDDGYDALEYALPKIEAKITNGNVFTL